VTAVTDAAAADDDDDDDNNAGQYNHQDDISPTSTV